MTPPTALIFPIEKAIYLFTRESLPGKGGDKQKFWKEILEVKSPADIRDAILKSVKLSDLYFREVDVHGDRYQAVTEVNGPTGTSRLVRTGWIVRHNEDIARFVTAVPKKYRG